MINYNQTMSKEDKIVYELIKKVYKVLLTKSIIYIFIADWFFFSFRQPFAFTFKPLYFKIIQAEHLKFTQEQHKIFSV